MLWCFAQALLALKEGRPHMSVQLHAAAVTAVLCLSRGGSPGELAATLQLPTGPAAQLAVRNADIQIVAQLVWEGACAPQCALAAAQARNP